MTSVSNDFEEQLADLLRFTGNRTTTGNPAFILIMGMTGAGKSTLIRHCTGKNVQVGHGLQSCTNNLAVHSFFHSGHHVHMIDTPGFDDTNRSDVDTLKTITSYLSTSFANGVRINGIIYLHRISDNRISGTGLRNLRMFRELSGSNAWPNTVIGTTMWAASEYAQDEARERELAGDVNYFGDLLSHGAKLFRVADHGSGAREQKRSALRIVLHLLQRMRILPAIDLKIQRELVLERKTLDATGAGQEALGDLLHLRRQLAHQVESAQHDIQEALRSRDIESTRQLKALKNECTRKISESKQQQEELKVSLEEMHDKEVNKLLARLDDMESQHHAALENRRQELKDLEDSLELMREQSAIDEARWKRQALDIAALERKRQSNNEANRECEQSVVALRQQVVQQQQSLGSIDQAKVAVQSNVMNGMANGIATGATTAMATLVLGSMCVVS